MTKKNTLFLVGLMGAGKTSVGKYLAQRLGLRFYDTDQVVEERCGANLSWIFDVEGEQGFREREARVIAELALLDNVVVSTGGGAVLQPQTRQILADKGIVIYLKASVDQLVVRTRLKHNRPLLLNANPREVLENLLHQRGPIYETIADVIVVNEENSVLALGEKVLTALRQMDQNTSDKTVSHE